MAMSFVDDSSIISELDSLNMNGSYEPSEGMGGPPPPPPPPGGASGGGPPPPPPPPPGPGMLPSYKQQKDQSDQESGKSLAEKLSGGKKSESKPFSYGISAADLMTPSAIKRQNAARIAAGGGSETPSRPSTPSAVRRPSGDANDGSPAATGIKALASQIQSLQARPAPTDQVYGASPSISPVPSFNPYVAAPASTPPLKPPSANDYGNSGQPYGNRGTQSSIKSSAPTPAYDHLSDWARNTVPSDDEGVGTSPVPSVYGRSSQPPPQQNHHAPQVQYQPPPQQQYQPPNVQQQYQIPQQQQHHYEMPQQQQRQTPTLVRQESQGERSRAAQMLEQIRNSYNSGTPAAYQQNQPVESVYSPSYGAQNTYGSSPYQSQPKQTHGSSSYYNENANGTQKSQQPYRASPTYSQAQPQPSYSSQPSRQSVSPTPNRPSYQTQSSYTSQPSTPAYVNYGGQRPAPEPVAYRTLPYSSYVTPTNVDFNSDPSWNNSSFGFQQQSQAQPQPRFTSQLRTEIRVPVRSSRSPDYYSSAPQRSSQNSYERIIPVQIQYQQMPAPKQNWGQTGLSDF